MVLSITDRDIGAAEGSAGPAAEIKPWMTQEDVEMNFLVNLDVDDLDKAARFYGSAFGLKVGRRFGAFGIEMLGSRPQSTCSLNHLGRRPQIQPCSVGVTSDIGRRSILISWLTRSNRRFRERYRLERA